ncbi:MAG: septum formation initiator family protein [Candidatus Beckwithbacteria bacterium]|nr:septum formation initiator family protein [Candidatus Beckwithbacteria bacterium]
MSTGKKRIFVYLIMILSVTISVKLIKDIIKLKAADKRIIEAEQGLTKAKNEQEQLKQKLAESTQGDWWEKQVRNVLNMARPGEEVVVVPEEVGKVTEVTKVIKVEEELTNWQKWWQVFSK